MSVKPSGHTFTVQPGETILAAARRAGVWLPFECGWGSCGTCKVTLVEGQVECLFNGAPALSDRDRRRRRIIACQSVPVSDLVLEGRVLDAPPEWLVTGDYRAALKEVVPLAPEIALFRMGLDRPAIFRPGQYAILTLRPGLRRAYSMANLPGTREVEFIARRYPGGAGSRALFELTPGNTVDLELPYGSAYLRDTDRPLVFVAGGTGIAPVLGLTRRWAASGGGIGKGLHIFYGARTPQDLVCLDDLHALIRGFPGARLVAAVNEGSPGWSGEVGFITDALVRRLPGEWDQYEWYVAGPPAMVHSVLRLLEARGVPVTQVHYDSFG